MNDDTNTLHPWIEPELEARLTALVLGEASDFERDELERLVAARPELGLYRKRLEAMHRMLREVSMGESTEKQGEWKLGAERRAVVLARLSGEVKAEEKVVVMSGSKRRLPWGMIFSVAACVMVAALALGLMYVVAKPEHLGVADEGSKVNTNTHAGGLAWDDPQAVEDLDKTGEKFQPAQTKWNHYYATAEKKSAVDREGEQFALADRAIRLPAPTSATSAPPAEPMEVDKPGQIGALNGTVAIGAGGIALGVDPNSPGKLSVTTSGNSYTNVRVGGGFDGRDVESPPAAEMPVASTLGGENTYTAGTAITGGGVLAINSPESPDVVAVPVEATNSFSAFDVPGSGQDVSNVQGMTMNPSMTMSGFESKVAEVVRRSAVPQQANAGKVEGEKNSQYEFGTTEVELTESSVPEIRRDLLAPQPSVPIARSRPATAAPASDPAAGEPALEQQVTKLGAGTLALNGGVVEVDGFIDRGRFNAEPNSPPAFIAEGGDFFKSSVGASVVRDAQDNMFDPLEQKTDAPASAPGNRGDSRFTGDLQVNSGIEARTGTVTNSRSFGSGGVIADASEKKEGEGFGFESPAKTDRVSRAAGGGVVAGQEGDVSRLGRSVAVEKSMEDSIAQGLDLADTDRTRNHVIRRELPFAIKQSGTLTGTVNFGDAISTIEDLSGFFEVAKTSSLDPETEQRLKKMRYFPDDGSESKRLANEEVDKSVQDILALTPQVGQDISQDRDRMEMLYEVVPRIVGGGSESGTRILDSSLIADGDALFPSLDDVIMRSGRPTPAALAETSPSAEPFSTFSLHVSDVSFQLAKSSLASGKWPEAEKIRIEEFVNAFDYGDPMPAMEERVAARIDQGAHPFLQQRNLVRIALRTAEAGRSSGTPLRLTLLLDSSGSMERPDRRETLTRAVATLAGLLGENDRITLVSFARQPRLVADAVAGNEAMKLAGIVASLPSEGGTNLEAALELAFEKAREHQEANAQNRIVLLTDGAANLGDAKAESLGARVEMMREAGIAFDAAGFGAEGLNDEILEALTRKGDGRYYLLDRPEDAEDAFAKQIAGALRPAAKNVKVQVEFNPDRVKSYKLLGFEKHRLETEDFRNDAVDAAELGAAEAGVAVYQVEPDPAGEGDLGSVSVRFRDLDSDEMVERRWALPHLATAPPARQGGDAILLATVASQFAAKLAGGPLGDVVDLGELARLAAALPESERVKELRTMIEQARELEGDR